MLRLSKFEQRYIDPFRVTEILGSTIFCKNLANGRFKQINMDMVRLAEDITMLDNDQIGSAYPIIEDGSQEEEDDLANDITDNTANRYGSRAVNINDEKKVIEKSHLKIFKKFPEHNNQIRYRAHTRQNRSNGDI